MKEINAFMDPHPLGFTAGGELHKFVLYYMKKENIVGLLLISSSSIDIRKEVSDPFFCSLQIYYHERYNSSKQRTVYELDS